VIAAEQPAHAALGDAAAQHDARRRGRRVGTQRLCEADAVDDRHQQVGDDEVGPDLQRFLEGVAAVDCRHHSTALGDQHAFERLEHLEVVVRDEGRERPGRGRRHDESEIAGSVRGFVR